MTTNDVPAIPLPQTAEQVLADLGKIRTADHARLLADNQRLLDLVHRHDARERDLSYRIQEADARRRYGADLPPAELPTDEEMHIYIDSPITVHPPAAAPVAAPQPAAQPVAAAAAAPTTPQLPPVPAPAAPPPPVKSLAAKLAPYALLAASTLGAGGLGAAAAARLLAPPQPDPATVPTEAPVYDVEIWRP